MIVETTRSECIPSVGPTPFGVNGGRDKCPNCGKERKNDQVIEAEESIKIVDDVTFSRRLSNVTSTDGQSAEKDR